jgi:glyoxylase-like metal-dependent hydrolase (beta-lactamase superfamily II)
MAQQINLHSDSIADLCDSNPPLRHITENLAYRQVGIVNVIFYGKPGAADREWVLIDAGTFGTSHLIEEGAISRFGESRPAAIILTHGHFDHVGSLETLAHRWEVPIFAHPSEFPYLDGRASYPPANPSAGGGLMSLLSPLYPRGPINVKDRLQEIPSDGSVPGMQGWQWISTPGHSPGHISLWHEDSKTLIAGDAFITTAQESAYAIIRQAPEIHGPPKYFTPDWVEAGLSVAKLAGLAPDLVVTGHGPALRGARMQQALQSLAEHFEDVAVPF